MGNQVHLISRGVVNIIKVIFASCVPYFSFLEYCGLCGIDVCYLPCYVISNIGDGTLTVGTVTRILCIACDVEVCFFTVLGFL